MKNPFLYLLLLIAFTSCSDNVKFNNPAFEGQKDNVFWRASDSKATLHSGWLTIEGYLGYDKLTLVFPAPQSSVKLSDKKSYVTYVLGTANNKEIAAFYVSSTNGLNPIKYQTLVVPGPVSKVLITSQGKGYIASGGASTAGGTGSGLKLSTTVTSIGAVSAVTVTSEGSGYTSGDVITISGGDGNAKLIVQNVTNSNGEIVITEYNAVSKIVSGTFKFNGVTSSSDPLINKDLNFQYGNFYLPISN